VADWQSKLMSESIINPQSPMSAVLETFPGAQRALFRRYHIGGCSSCGFQPTETLAEVCTRNGNLAVAEVLAHIQSSHEGDAKVLISPKELADLLQRNKSVKLVDVRSREEFEAVNIPGSILLSQPVMQRAKTGWMRRRISWATACRTSAACAAALMRGRRKWSRRCGVINWAE
jgi:hypothetical protein